MNESLNVETLAHETRSNIELKRNAKGEYAWDIKIFFDGDSADERAAVPLRLFYIDDALRKLFLREERDA